MSLSCSCDYGDGGYDWYWWPPKDYTRYRMWTSRLCCCEGCTNRISYNDTVAEVCRTRPPTEWEINNIIGWGDENDPEYKNLASVWMCERCADLFFSFDDLGFECVSPYENMIKLAKEYYEVYQSKKHISK